MGRKSASLSAITWKYTFQARVNTEELNLFLRKKTYDFNLDFPQDSKRNAISFLLDSLELPKTASKNDAILYSLYT